MAFPVNALFFAIGAVLAMMTCEECRESPIRRQAVEGLSHSRKQHILGCEYECYGEKRPGSRRLPLQ